MRRRLIYSEANPDPAPSIGPRASPAVVDQKQISPVSAEASACGTLNAAPIMHPSVCCLGPGGRADGGP